jgi:hypothetical protein
MRIRQVRPEFWTDEVIAALPIPARFFYIGLWNVADDAGWMEWRVSRIGAVLFPYEPTRRRERDIGTWSAMLVEAGRLIVHPCGCAVIPTLPKHQRVTGKQSFSALEAHGKHQVLTDKQSPLSDSPVTERNVKERNVLTVEGLAALRDAEDEADRQKLRAIGRLRQ